MRPSSRGTNSPLRAIWSIIWVEMNSLLRSSTSLGTPASTPYPSPPAARKLLVASR